MAGSICDVCLTGETIGVCSSAVGPISNAYCAECHRRMAEPEWSFNYLWDGVCDGDITKLAEFVLDLSTFKDGRYWTFAEWAEWRQWQWFEPDPMFHWWAFEPHGPLKPSAEFLAMMEPPADTFTEMDEDFA